MAASAADRVEDEDDEFDAYNPHPYAGGYDISATYGAPLPPSSSICYPVSSPATATPSSALPAPAAPSLPSPVPATPSSPAKPPPSPVPVAEPYYWPKPHDYGDAPRYHPMYPTPEVFRGWPYLPRPLCHSRCCPRDYWRQCMRGLDYLFGHSDGYGERRIGVDCHGAPVYANKKGSVEDAVVVEVAPPAIGNVEWHDAGQAPDQSNRLSWYDNAKEDTCAYAQPTYDSYAKEDQPTYDSYAKEDTCAYAQPNYDFYVKEDMYEYAQLTYGSYDTSYEQSYSLHGVSDEPTWFPYQSYQDVYKEEESQYQEPLSSYDAENKISTQPIYCYNQHFGEQSLHIQVEPPETVHSHKLEYYENFSTYDNQNNIDNLDTSRHSWEIQPYAHIPDDPVEPYKPSWSMNLEYYETCTGGVAPQYDDHTLASDEYRDMASLFESSFYPQQTQIYEQSHGDESTSLQQNLQSNWNVFSEDASQITKSGEDSNHVNGSFWSFGGYSTYAV